MKKHHSLISPHQGFFIHDSFRNAIEKWDNIEIPEKSSIMANIRQMIKPEVMYLRGRIWHDSQTGKTEYYGPNIEINKNHYYIDIYQYYYGEQDYQRERGNNPPKPYVSNVNPEPQPSFPTTYPQPQSKTNPQPQQRILTFEEYLQQHPGLLYLTELEQREEYYKYLASMGVQPPSSTTRSNSSDNSSYGTGNTEDDSVW